jgi:hypothetical protein
VPRVVQVARILESPWPEWDGRPCDCIHRTGAVEARYVVWTEEDTGDGPRVSCGACLPDWVDCVTVRLTVDDGPARPYRKPASCGHPADEDGACGCASWPERAPLAG